MEDPSIGECDAQVGGNSGVGPAASVADKTPEATLYAAMLREIAKKGDAARADSGKSGYGLSGRLTGTGFPVNLDMRHTCNRGFRNESRRLPLPRTASDAGIILERKSDD